MNYNTAVTDKYDYATMNQVSPWPLGCCSGNSYEQGRLVKTDIYGNVFVAGITGAVETPDYLIIKYYQYGNQFPPNTYNGTGNGSDIVHDMAVDNSGAVYITGESI